MSELLRYAAHISLCRCWTDTAESGEVYGPQSDEGACEGAPQKLRRALPSIGALGLSAGQHALSSKTVLCFFLSLAEAFPTPSRGKVDGGRGASLRAGFAREERPLLLEETR